MPEIFTLLPLIFPWRFPPGHVTYCREIWLQQPKGPGHAQGRTKAGGFGHAMEHTACCFQPLFGKGVQFASLSASKKSPGTLLSWALGCCWLLTAWYCRAVSHSASHWKNWIILNCMCRWFSFCGLTQHREGKLANQFCFSLQPSSQVVFNLSKVWIIDVYLFRESLDWNIIKIV